MAELLEDKGEPQLPQNFLNLLYIYIYILNYIYILFILILYYEKL